MTEKMINNLIEMGATKWEKYGKSRLYLNAAGYDIVGLECNYYKTGNISGATLNGEHISNGLARSYTASLDKAYIDLLTGELHISNDSLRETITDWMIEQEAIENEVEKIGTCKTQGQQPALALEQGGNNMHINYRNCGLPKPRPLTPNDWNAIFEIIDMVRAEINVNDLDPDEKIVIAYNVRDEAFTAAVTDEDAEYEHMIGADWVEFDWESIVCIKPNFDVIRLIEVVIPARREEIRVEHEQWEARRAKFLAESHEWGVDPAF